jgi:glucose-1-phosphate thymidylyltransferase
MKGIILAGGSGTRLYPATQYISKQLLPVYNQPMIYYPLNFLIESGIKEILIISTPQDLGKIKELLNGFPFIKYAEQANPNGIAEAFIIGKKFIGRDNVTLILGDNFFFNLDIKEEIKSFKSGALLFGKQVDNPKAFGVPVFENDKLVAIEEKPQEPKSNLAITGLYVYDNSVVKKAHNLKPSIRNELEITDINNLFIKDAKLIDIKDAFWLDMGTYDNLLLAANYIKDNVKLNIHLNTYNHKLISLSRLLKEVLPYHGSDYFKEIYNSLPKNKDLLLNKAQINIVRDRLSSVNSGLVKLFINNKYIQKELSGYFPDLDIILKRSKVHCFFETKVFLLKLNPLKLKDFIYDEDYSKLEQEVLKSVNEYYFNKLVENKCFKDSSKIKIFI